MPPDYIGAAGAGAHRPVLRTGPDRIGGLCVSPLCGRGDPRLAPMGSGRRKASRAASALSSVTRWATAQSLGGWVAMTAPSVRDHHRRGGSGGDDPPISELEDGSNGHLPIFFEIPKTLRTFCPLIAYRCENQRSPLSCIRWANMRASTNSKIKCWLKMRSISL